jgi:hypothetical protein
MQSNLTSCTKSVERRQLNATARAPRDKLKMAKHNLAVLLGLLCLLAAIWATGMANDVPQKRFKMKGSAGYMRGMYSMIEAEKYEYYGYFGEQLSEAVNSESLTRKTREKIQEVCREHYRDLCAQGSLSKEKFRSNMDACETKEKTAKKFTHWYRYGDYAKVMWALIEIGNVDGRCDQRDQWELFLSANGARRLSGTKDKFFISYVSHFGKKKLTKCAPKAVDFMSEIPENITDDFDSFFKALFKLPGAGDRQLHERLSHANLLENELDFAPTLKLPKVIEKAREVRKKGDDYEAKNGQDVMAFISHVCEHMAEESKGMLDVILLSEDSVKKSELDDRVKKWIEYDHACWYLVKHQKKFIRHVDRLLGTQSAMRKIADLITCHDCRASRNPGEEPSRADVEHRTE